MQPDAFADAVVVMVKNALGPVLERMATLEARQAILGDLRDRMVVVETKAAQPVVLPAVDVPPPVDLTPVFERVAATEARLETLGDLRDRVVVMETKAAVPVPSIPVVEPLVPVDLSPVLERVAATEARLSVLGDLRDRVVTIETKAAQPVQLPVVSEPSPVDLSPVLERLAASEARLEVLGDLRDRVVTIETKAAVPIVPVDVGDVRERLVAVEASLKGRDDHVVDIAPLVEKFDALGTDVNALRERIAVAEMRPLVPGPMGHDGRDGQNGRDGKDGLDGLGWDDLSVAQVDERTFTVKCLRGLQVKELGTLTFPVEIYKGVYVDGKTYDRGDGVTWGGSEWHCNDTTTTKPGDGSKAWTLKVKRGRDGKDGRDLMPSVPVISVGKR